MSEILTPQNGDHSRDDRPRLVLDTNTVLALWMFRDPKLAALREWIEAGKCRLYSREDALEELRRVLKYEQFGLTQGLRTQIYAAYAGRLSSPCAASPLRLHDEALQLPRCKDSDDQKFLEITALCGAQVLVTRDRALLRLAKDRRIRSCFAIIIPEKLFTAIQDA